MYFVRLLVLGPAFSASGSSRRVNLFGGLAVYTKRAASGRNLNEAAAAEHGCAELGAVWFASKPLPNFPTFIRVWATTMSHLSRARGVDRFLVPPLESYMPLALVGCRKKLKIPTPLLRFVRADSASSHQSCAARRHSSPRSQWLQPCGCQPWRCQAAASHLACMISAAAARRRRRRPSTCSKAARSYYQCARIIWSRRVSATDAGSMACTRLTG